MPTSTRRRVVARAPLSGARAGGSEGLRPFAAPGGRAAHGRAAARRGHGTHGRRDVRGPLAGARGSDLMPDKLAGAAPPRISPRRSGDLVGRRKTPHRTPNLIIRHTQPSSRNLLRQRIAQRQVLHVTTEELAHLGPAFEVAVVDVVPL